MLPISIPADKVGDMFFQFWTFLDKELHLIKNLLPNSRRLKMFPCGKYAFQPIRTFNFSNINYERTIQLLLAQETHLPLFVGKKSPLGFR